MKHNDPETRVHLPEIRRVKKAAGERLLRTPGVGDVGISLKAMGGKRTFDFVIIVYLTPKKPLPQLPAEELIPSKIDGVNPDVKESGRSHVLGKSDTVLYRRFRGSELSIHLLRRDERSSFELITKPERDPRFALLRETLTTDIPGIDHFVAHCSESSGRDHLRLPDDSYCDLPRRNGMSEHQRHPGRAVGKDSSSTCSDCRNERIGVIPDVRRPLHKLKRRPVIRPRGQRR